MDLEEAYRLYADRLFTYARGILGDHDSAADAVHDTFVLASQRSGQLRDPDRLMSWLYTITRREALRHLRRRSRIFPVETLPPVPHEDSLSDLRHAELSELVWAAYGGLVDNDREIIELSVRHGLSSTDIATVLDISIKHANARIARARAQVSICLGVLLVARAPRVCEPLAELLGDWDGKLTPLLRKRLHRHIDSCVTCSGQRQRRMDPAAILSGYAATPFLVYVESSRPPAPPRRVGKYVLGATVVVLLIGIPAALARPQSPRPPDMPTSMTSLGPSAEATSRPSALPPVQPSAQPSPDKPSPKPPVAFNVTAGIGLRCLSNGHYSLTVQATSNSPMTQAILLWQAGSGPIYFDTMDIKPSKVEASGSGSGLSSLKITWWIKANGADGSVDRTSAITENNPCA